MKIPYSEMQKKQLSDYTRNTKSRLFNETPKFVMYMFYCRVMCRVWDVVHPWLHGRFKFDMFGELTNCTHKTNFRRAYNDLRDFEKKIDKMTH